MPVTTRVAPVDVRTAPALSTFNSTSLFQNVVPSLWKPNNTIMDSSFPIDIIVHPTTDFGGEEASTNGFVGTMLDAYRNHHHLVLRPEDVWFAILTQFSFYVNKHAEELRSHFVDFEGKRKLEIEQDVMDLPAFVQEITHMIQDNVKDPKLRDWIMPDFSTTTETDRVTASIIMMGTMQKYFAYFLEIGCGIPSVTLLGEQKDWQDILDRLDYLTTFGKKHPELNMWHSALTSVVSYMVDTFASPDSPDVVRFWQRSVHSYTDNYAGDKHITGWILGFCFWDTEGNQLASQYRASNWEQHVKKEGRDWWLNDYRFGALEWKNVPSAFVHVPIHVKDTTVYPPDKFIAKDVAGSVGWTVRDSEAVFKETRGRGRKASDVSGETLVGVVQAQKPGIFQQIAQKILCFKSDTTTTAPDDEKLDPSRMPFEDEKPERRFGGDSEVPQLSDLSELNKAWARENGGKHDALQPLTGWWVMRTTDGQYGKDPDVPDVEYDSDAEDYDEELAYKGRPLRERGEL